jgi:hypothetical protein
MQDILQKLSDLVKILEERIKDTNAISALLKQQKQQQADREVELNTKADALKIRESAVLRGEALTQKEAELKQLMAEASVAKQRAVDLQAKLEKDIRENAVLRDEIEKIRVMYKNKTANLEAEKVAFEERKKHIKEDIITGLEAKLKMK